MSEPAAIDRKQSILWCALIVAWGCVLARYLVRGFFGLADDEIHNNHESVTYIYRVIEFRAAIAEGHPSPQWCPDFRGGLGSPFFSYYQPALFYVASALPASVPAAKVLGLTVWLFAVVGYLGMVALVGRFFDNLSGVVAGSILLLSPYAGTELYVRGDLSEFAAMMCLPPMLWAFFSCIDRSSRGSWLTLVSFGGLLVCTHPCIALPAFGLLGLMSLFFLIDGATRWNAARAMAALALGGCLAGFYCLPVFLEIDYVGHEAAFTEFYHYSNHFISPLRLLGSYTRQPLIPFTLGNVVLIALLMNAAWLGYQWKRLHAGQRRLLVGLGMLMLVCVFLMTPFSRVVWQNVHLLERLQFPWRLLAIITVVAAGICGPILFLLEQRIRIAAAATVVAFAFWLSLAYTAPNLPTKFDVPESAAAMSQQFIAPDLRNEWLPTGAAAKFPDGIPKSPMAAGDVEFSNYQRDHARLSCEVRSNAGGLLTLPHYYFPVGWRATLADQPIELQAGDDGLMQFPIPPNSNGRLVVQFHMTPARRYGWMLSMAALAMMIAIAVFGRPLFESSDLKESRHDDESAVPSR